MPETARRAEEGDILESSLNLEEDQYDQGYEEGYNDGIKVGLVDGREVGLKNGFQSGEEIGFYRGCVDVWKAVVGINSSAFSQRAQKSINQLEDQLLAYPLLSPEDERLQDVLEAIRAKFQAILSMLAIRLEYPGYPKSKESVDDFSEF